MSVKFTPEDLLPQYMKVEDVKPGVRVCFRYESGMTLWGVICGKPVERFDIDAKVTTIQVEVEFEIDGGHQAWDINISRLYPEDAIDRLGKLA